MSFLIVPLLFLIFIFAKSISLNNAVLSKKVKLHKISSIDFSSLKLKFEDKGNWKQENFFLFQDHAKNETKTV